MSWEKIPGWTDRVLQGTAFWVGYKTQLYYYPLTEGAIVGEAAAIINSKLETGLKLKCEVQYKHLGVQDLGQARADLVIKENEEIKIVIEVKRATSSKNKVADDFKRLARVHRQDSTIRCFLLLVSQEYRPWRFVDSEGSARNISEIEEDGYKAKVRRVCKAARSFEGEETANYSCLIEVISNEK